LPSATPEKVTAAPDKAGLQLPGIGTAQSRSLEQVLAGRPTVTLQSMVLALQGVCTEPGLFYNFEGEAWVSEAIGTVFLGPKAGLRTDTFGNMIGIGNWHAACRLDGLYLAVLGTGQVEIRVFQVKNGRSWERLACELCDLSSDVETVIDLSAYALNAAAGGIWFELRNISEDEVATVTAARYLTCGQIEHGQRLALCVTESASGAQPDPLVRSRLLAWCSGPGKAMGATMVESDPGAQPMQQLLDAKAKGFSHALLMHPTTVLVPETLARTMAFLSLARDSKSALGAAVLDQAEKWFMSANGMIADRDGKPSARYQGIDLRDRLQVVSMECELAEEEEQTLVFQPEFLAIALTKLVPDTTGASFDAWLQETGIRLHHLTGVMVNREADDSELVGDLVTLQHVIYPEAGLCTEGNMYFHANGPFSYSEATGTLNIDERTIVHFDSYFNALNIGKWHANCKPKGLYLGLMGRGRVVVKAFHAIPDRSWELLCDAPYTLSTLTETLIDLSQYSKTAVTGMIYFELHAISKGVQLLDARFAVPGKINPAVKLCLSITTFKREEEVENTARRMAAFFKTSDFADQMHLNIVDNGNSANIIESDKITRIPNANLGGAGGFTRGLIEGEKAGYSHVLFMDDDASIPMEALHRAYAFLTLSKNPKAAVSGAMISNSDKWRMWENGAIFDRNCRPQFSGVDLRDWVQVMNMEFASASYRSPKMYGGWWFFAFPVKEVTHYPFPFFVRGDDINFSLANDFHITTLNGVVSFAEDFSDKESPMTLYLDLRNHFVQHLTLEKMEIGPLNIAKIGVGFFLRNIAKFQYETVDALLMAWNDVLKGPEFFAENADAAAQRAAVKAIYKVESWKPVAEMDLKERRRYWAGHGPGYKFFRLALNGHLLPFYKLWGNRIVLQPRDRNNFAPVWGASKITYLNSTREKAYTVTQSKSRFFAQAFRLLWLTARLYFGYGALLAKYRKGYAEITVPSFWQKALKLAKAPTAPAAKPEAAKP
jgi:galactofuranosylgalactofuranosylrhamnosyl-N-acetylglucosaminyl-diphospho-decaprenol beta-1,5/1,6-galactofuranosyltransferase